MGYRRCDCASWACSLAWLLMALWPLGLAHAGEIDVELTPATTKLRACDPLFVKVVIHNRSTSPFQQVRLLVAMMGGVSFEVRHLETGTVTYPYSGYGMSVVTGPLSIDPGESQSALELLLDWERHLIFARPGRYSIRAAIPLSTSSSESKQVNQFSNQVEVEVDPAPQQEIDLIEKSLPALSMRIRGPIGGAAPPDKFSSELKSLEQKLSDSVLKRTLRWSAAFQALIGATDDVTREKERTNLILVTQKLKVDAVTREVVDLLVAQALARMNQWEAVAELVTRYQGERNFFWDHLRTSLEARRGR